MKRISTVIGTTLIAYSCGTPVDSTANLSSLAADEIECHYGLLDDVTDPQADSKWAFLSQTTTRKTKNEIEQLTYVQEIFSDGVREDGYEEATSLITVDVANEKGAVTSKASDEYAGTISFSDGKAWEWLSSEISLLFKKRKQTMKSEYIEKGNQVFVKQTLTKANGRVILKMDGSIDVIDCGAEFDKRVKEITDPAGN